MPSKLMRRSGVAVGLVCEWLGWRADWMYQVGVGIHHEEVDVLKSEWKGLKVIGIEPHPAVAARLQQLNKFHKVYQVAVSDMDGEATLYGKQRHKDGSSLFPHRKRNDEVYPEFAVETRRLDSLFGAERSRDGRLGQRTLLWLDCEGSELAVLQGAKVFLRYVEVVNIETTGNPPGEGWCSPVDVHRLMKVSGFYRQWIHTNRSQAGQVDVVYVRRHLFKPEHCCCPCEVERYEER